MKKGLVLVISLLCLSLVGCGDKSSSNGTETAKGNVSDYSFKDNIVVMEDLTLEITDYKVIQPGAAGNEYGDKPVIAFWYNVTNTSEKEFDAITAWLVSFDNPIQDNDPNLINTLEPAALPDYNFLDSQTETIKPNGTVECACAYYLDDMTTPVLLKSHKGIGGEFLGEQLYEIEGK